MNAYTLAYQIVCSKSFTQIKNDFSYKDLTEDEKQELSAELWAEDDCDFIVLSENNARNKIEKSLFSTLKIGSLDSKIELADILKESIVDYYSKRSSELIEEATQEYMDEHYKSAGFVKRKFSDNGETYWSELYG